MVIELTQQMIEDSVMAMLRAKNASPELIAQSMAILRGSIEIDRVAMTVKSSALDKPMRITPEALARLDRFQAEVTEEMKE